MFPFSLISRLLLTALVLGLAGCIHKSTFLIPEEVSNSTVIDYCGGQQWGYVRPLGKSAAWPYHGVFLEFSTVEGKEVLLLNFVLESIRDLSVQFQSRTLEVFKDDQRIYKKPSSFWIVRDAKSIHQLYPQDEYSFEAVPDTRNEWRVHKRCKGLGCDLFWKPPFTVKINDLKNEVTTSDKIEVEVDPSLNRVYVMDKIVLPITEEKISSTTLKVVAPAFVANGVAVPASTHTFHFDRARLMRNLPAKHACLSVNQIFIYARGQRINPLSWILDPFTINSP